MIVVLLLKGTVLNELREITQRRVVALPRIRPDSSINLMVVSLRHPSRRREGLTDKAVHTLTLSPLVKTEQAGDVLRPQIGHG